MSEVAILLMTYLIKYVYPNKTNDLNLSFFNMMTEKNESKKLTKHIKAHWSTSCECKFKFDGKKWNSNQKWNNDKCWCECKNLKQHHVCEKDYIWNPATCSCENGNYLANIVNDSVTTCDEIIDAATAVPTNVNEKKIIRQKTSIFYSPFFVSQQKKNIYYHIISQITN